MVELKTKATNQNLKDFLSTIALIFSFSIFSGCVFQSQKTNQTLVSPNATPILDEQNASDSIGTEVNFTAQFEVYTLGTKRVFTNSMYHRQSSDVYIENQNPSIIYVKKSDITWNDFFKTLPLTISEDCLITGTKQTFCSTGTKKLRFFLNDLEIPTVLESTIQPNDSLRIIYGD